MSKRTSILPGHSKLTSIRVIMPPVLSGKLRLYALMVGALHPTDFVRFGVRTTVELLRAVERGAHIVIVESDGTFQPYDLGISELGFDRETAAKYLEQFEL